MVVPPPKRAMDDVLPLHMHHSHDGQEMSCGQAVCGGVKADVKGYFFLSEELSYLLLDGYTAR